jgi:hypothetical protein
MRKIYGPLPRDPDEKVFIHAMDHAVNGDILFAGPDDVKKYEEIVKLAADKTGVEILAHTANFNHHHQGLLGTLRQLSQYMHMMQFLYADYSNRKRKRLGRLFFRNFKACIKATIRAIRRCLAYININRYKDNAVGSFLDPQMDSHRAYLGLQPAAPFLKVEKGLAYFDPDPVKARQKYAELAASIGSSLQRLEKKLGEFVKRFEKRVKGQIVSPERIRYLLLLIEDLQQRLGDDRLTRRFGLNTVVAYALECEEGISARSAALLLDCDRNEIHRGLEGLRKYLEARPTSQGGLILPDTG